MSTAPEQWGEMVARDPHLRPPDAYTTRGATRSQHNAPAMPSSPGGSAQPDMPEDAYNKWLASQKPAAAPPAPAPTQAAVPLPPAKTPADIATVAIQTRLDFVEAALGGQTPDTDRGPLPRAPHRLELLAGGGSGFPWSKTMFGFKLDPNGNNALEVMIYAGRIGDIVVGEDSVTLSGDAYVWLDRTKSDNTVIVGSGAAWPTDNATHAYYVLYYFTVADDAAALASVIRPYLRPAIEVPVPNSVGKFMLLSNGGVLSWIEVEPFSCPV